MTEYSPQLRAALSDALALVSNQFSDLTNAGEKARWTSAKTVRKLLDDAPTERWISLSPQLPALAEAAPEIFLDAIEQLLRDDERVRAIYAREGKGFMGGPNPMTGILWALEALAWSPEYLPRATLALGGFDNVDPGGTWGNRALSSLTHIFLPWLPQTLADGTKRASALLALSRDYDATAWALYLTLLPNATQTSSGTNKPKWLVKVPDDLPSVTRKEYLEQVNCYATRVVTMAALSDERLLVLTSQLDRLPNEAFEQALALYDNAATRLGDGDIRYEIWRELGRLAVRHHRSPEADWAMGEVRLGAIRKIAAQFEPISPTDRYLPLFASDNYQLFDEDDDWSSREAKLAKAQSVAASAVWHQGGIDRVQSFASEVDNPFALGWALGTSVSPSLSEGDLHHIVAGSSRPQIELAAGYVSQGHSSSERPLGEFEFLGWTPSEIADLLSTCRIETSAVWEVAERKLGHEKSLFWRQAHIQLVDNPGDLHHVVTEYLAAGRPLAAIRAIHFYAHRYNGIDEADTLSALMAAVSTDEDPANMDSYSITSLIQRLQRSTSVDKGALSKIEWAYLEILNRPGEASPQTLEQRLADDPGFFCEVIRAIFRSKDLPSTSSEPSKVERRVASNAYRLLMNWSTPPGTQQDGTFSGNQFAMWLADVVKECRETGHVDVALHQVGPVLVHVPPDASGLWIDTVVAEQLNRLDMEELRAGYRTGIFNSRGVHWVDPSGEPEFELASKFAERAEDSDKQGFARLASTMRQLAKEYAGDAARIRSEHGATDEGQ